MYTYLRTGDGRVAVRGRVQAADWPVRRGEGWRLAWGAAGKGGILGGGTATRTRTRPWHCPHPPLTPFRPTRPLPPRAERCSETPWAGKCPGASCSQGLPPFPCSLGPSSTDTSGSPPALLHSRCHHLPSLPFPWHSNSLSRRRTHTHTTHDVACTHLHPQLLGRFLFKDCGTPAPQTPDPPDRVRPASTRRTLP